MTDIDTLINEVQRLDGEATPGPWEVLIRPVRTIANPNEIVDRVVGITSSDEIVVDGDGVFGDTEADADLIATFRTAAPLLAAEVQRLQAALDEARLTLAAEQGKPEGAPDPTWEPRGGLLRTWWRDYRDGTIGTVHGNPDGSARWWRGEPGILVFDGDDSRTPRTIAEGIADSKRAAMRAADKATP